MPMANEIMTLLNEINRAIIQFRGIYSTWSGSLGISYNEMLVFYTIREQGYCTQKQICDHYLLPRQTMHHVITGMRKNGLLQYSRMHSFGREKAFVLSAKGQACAKPFLQALNDVETRAVSGLGADKLQALTQLLLQYNQALQDAMDEQKEHRI